MKLGTADIIARMAQLATDSAVLQKEVANFERIAESLKDQVARVQQTASEMIADHNWKGSARDAAQVALNRYVEAAQAMTRGLNDNSTNLYNAGLLYQATDDERSSRLSQALVLAMTRATNSTGTCRRPMPSTTGTFIRSTA